ncbi:MULTISPECIES: TetR/AcrR family transcriptional regulator [Pantoea]|jgi:AcrR family transcriptional regulator|uniref:TetR/AcrR family transcriptional regulator n=1 Tax=Pantoea TaxID=53335 RepID=UPI0006605A0F|nr:MULTISPECIES: TetR/AcrR family transcriptional regulator [Pantoea]MBS6436670.1 TetR/AcrR family transcriptional regulator [Pantoea sp.]MDU1572653.1 helix-turn-helix domain-containing protein [Pantoea sp.]MDU2727796.1 helix-turn-helix domain-containing protein [Pantoea sp.]MDU5472937.1 helix-turn-helix domain-containing protein [Pantoea sp.]MDU6078646.1 helix-turn-helix domain-containing protein [Pantoea sp.]
MNQQREARDARHRTRQDEIIAAARRCFRQSGFHGASMAQLASAASLSVGQIYRYFPSKDALIEEMVKRIVDGRVAAMSAQSDASHIADMIARRETLHDEDEMLMLEVAAEASRNPRVSDILQAAETRLFHNACEKMRADYPHLTEPQRAACVEVLAVLIEGTAFRRLTTQKASADLLHTLYKQMIHNLVNPSEDK